MILTIDIGNTFTKVALFDKQELVYSNWNVPLFAESWLENFQQQYPQIESVMVLSVQGIPAGLETQLKSWFTKVEILTHEFDFPFKVAYHSKESLGTDRLAAVAGAQSLFPCQDLLVLDIGTAITFDVLTATGQYLGGNISLGMDMRFEALHRFTSKLPLVDRELTEQHPKIGKTTHSAIYNGVVLGIQHELDAYINLTRERYPKLRTVLTGGDAPFFEKRLKNKCITNKNLIFVGLNFLSLRKKAQ